MVLLVFIKDAWGRKSCKFWSHETFSLQFPKSEESTCASSIYRYSHSDTGPLEIQQDTSNKYLKANQKKIYLADIWFCVLRLSAEGTSNITDLFKDVETIL